MPIFDTFVKSPLNYTGNKYRILSQIQPHFPQSIGTMVDLFCGGATVGLNTPCRNVQFVDNNPYVIHLLQYLATCQFNNLLCKLENLLQQYGLSYSAQNSYAFYYQKQTDQIHRNNGLKEYNLHGFYQLREDYNALSDKACERANLLLYLLIVYGFNNDIRFSKDGYFNLPIGKTDLNKNNIRKLKTYIERVQSIQADFICGDFRAVEIQNLILSADFVYADPPYLITNAVYNESDKWNSQAEQALLSLLGEMLQHHIPFALSNMLEKGQHKNVLLDSWLHQHPNVQMIDIDYHYRGAYYNKKERNGEHEILIVPVYE